MSEKYIEMARSPLMWIVCGIPLLWVVIQALVFYKRSYKDGLKMGVTEIQMKRATKSAIIASVGPCFVMLTAMLSLMVYVGAPLAWLRVDFIGSVSFELMGAQFVADAMGIELGGAEMNADFLCAAAIVMSAACIAWILFSIFFADKMDKVNLKLAGGNKAIIPAIGAGAIIGCYASVTMDRIYPYGPNVYAVAVSAFSMIALEIYNKKAKKQWIKEWGTTLCMILGMVAAAVSSMTIFA